MTLTPCPSCARHVRATTCPFCGAEVAPPRTVLAPLATRAAFLVGSVALAAGCNTPPAPAYGGPPTMDPPSTPVVTAPTDTLDAGAGAPVVDAAVRTSEIPVGPAPAYGGPPPSKK